MKKLIPLLLLFVTTPVFANPKINYNEGIYHIELDNTPKTAKRIDFIAVPELETNAQVHKINKSILTINTGFFDPNNKKTISYIESITSGFEDPMFNEALVTNPVLNKNLNKILNRSEFRVLECDNEIYEYDIAPHNELPSGGCFIRTAAQGGPEIIPNLRLEEEFFIQKDKQGNIIRESCSVLHKVPRTIIAIKNKNLHIFIFTNKAPMTLPEVREYLLEFGVDKAMGFDGGSSTSLNYKDEIQVISTQNDGNDTGRKLKSFMIFK